MLKNTIITILISLFVTTSPSAKLDLTSPIKDNKTKIKYFKEQKKEIESKSYRTREFQYGYIDRSHTFTESLKHVVAMYGVTWIVYPLSQPKIFREDGSWKKYKKNFGQIVFDRDEPFWNWFVHPISGSQLYLYYRANGYDRINSLGMAFISSTLFEFTVEIYTEPASIQDLYQTPVLGSLFGVGLETLSMYLLGTGNAVGRFFGHVLNPSTLFWFYEGKVQIVPRTNLKDSGGLFLMADF
jgi:hypothetical protein